MRQAKHFRNRNGGGVMEDLLRSTRDLVAGTLLESVKEASREILRRTMTVTLLYAVAAALLGAGLILLLIGGFEALRLIPLPDAAAYAIMGLLALGGGFVAVRSAARRNET
jgi:drug/metabolite transporter (DMT)-like permease